MAVMKRRALLASLAGAPLAGSASGRPGAKASARPSSHGVLDVRILGAVGDGVTDDTALLRSAGASGSSLRVPEGVYLISGAVTFLRSVLIDPGARFTGAGAVTFDQGFEAGLEQVFSDGVAAVFNSRFLTTGHAEWWGARTNDAEFDNTPALQAALDSVQTVQLMGGDYYYSGNLAMRHPSRVLRGVASNQNGKTRESSRLMLTSPINDGLRVGFEANPSPGNFSEFLEHVVVERLSINRVVPPRAAPATKPEGRGFFASPAGIRVRFAVTCQFLDVNVVDHSIGFYVEGGVHCYFNHCQALRNVPGANRSNDFFVGFFQNATDTIGANTGEASMYYSECSVFGRPNGLTFASGFYAYGGWTDTFIHRLETANMDTAINMNADNTAFQFPSEDLIISDCVLDGCTAFGIHLNGGNELTAVTIHNTYVAIVGSDAAALHVVETRGPVSVTGCQFIGGGFGAKMEFSSGVSLVNNIFTEMKVAILFANSTNCESTADTINNAHTPGSPDGLVQFASSSRCIFRSKIMNTRRSTLSLLGVALTIDPRTGRPCDHNEICGSGIDPTALSGGADKKIEAFGTPVTIVGAFGSRGSVHNLATGILN